MHLTGTWRAALADEDLRRAFRDPGFDDSGWAPVEVPGHWRSTPEFASADGPILHRRSFEAGLGGQDRRAWLWLDGLFYQGDVWLDGRYLGDTEGYFVPHRFEVTQHLRAAAEHHLAIEVTCTPQRDKAAKRNLTGVFQHWDCLDPDWNPGGIWRPVRLVETGPVAIVRLRAVCLEATAARAVLALHATLDSDVARTAALRTTVGGAERWRDQPLAAGANEVSWTFTVNRPALWWPRALGDPALHEVAVEVRLGQGAPDGRALAGGALACSDRRVLRTGLREVRLRSWIASVNGERLYLKGSNQGPTRMALAEASAEELRRDVELACEAGLDLLRVHGHVTRPELYDAADEAGLLLWQDFPMQWGYARGVRRQAVRQAAAMVDQLGHHPSVAIWCGHNEPMALDLEPGDLADRRALLRATVRAAVAQQLPTWNRSVLDRSVKRAIERADPSRPVIAHSGVLPHLPQLEGTDSHLYFGWYWGRERDFPRLCRAVPRLARFVSEFGAQAVPASAEFCEPARWPHLDWARLGRSHALQKRFFDRYVPPWEHETFESWQAATQAYQATVIRHHIEHLRRLKYRPSGGFAQFCFADGHPGVTWSVLGHDRAPKAGFAALRAACQPVIVVADRLPAELRPGARLALEVHVVSDLRQDLEGAVLEAVASWPGGERRWLWAGEAPADSCLRVGVLRLVAPAAPGELALDLSLRWRGGQATNGYRSRIQT